MKQVKWNKKRKWSNTRYCKPFKARFAIRQLNAAMIAAGAQLQASSIAAQQSGSAIDKLSKALAIGNLVADTQKRVADELAKGGKL